MLYQEEELLQEDFGPLYAEAERSKCLGLGYKGLVVVPGKVFELKYVLRLELNNNRLNVLSPGIGAMRLLEELWLNDNPLLSIPSEVSNCEKLRVLDLGRTKIEALPFEVGLLKDTLQEIELSETPYASQYPFANNTKRLVVELWRSNETRRLRNGILDKVNNGIYRELADEYTERITAIVDAVVFELQALDELKNVLRNADRLFPLEPVKKLKILPTTIATNIHTAFTALKKANARKRLSAELELKLRAFYYDRIDVTRIESYISDIFHIPKNQGNNDNKALDLKDLQFLIQHATKILPPEASLIHGTTIRANVFALQQELDDDRARHRNDVADALLRIYPDVEPNDIKSLNKAVCDTFTSQRFATKRELDHLKILAADASIIFPNDFSRAKPAKVKAKFLERLLLLNGGSTSSSSHIAKAAVNTSTPASVLQQ